MAQDSVKLEVFRYHPEGNGETLFDTFEVPYREDWVVLDALNHVKDEIDGSLTYRWSHGRLRLLRDDGERGAAADLLSLPA